MKTILIYNNSENILHAIIGVPQVCMHVGFQLICIKSELNKRISAYVDNSSIYKFLAY